MNRRQIGKLGEDLCVMRLEAEGFRILERNFFTRYGEIDIIADKAGMLVFVEVKTRNSDLYGYPEESVNAKKREHMRAAASYFLQEKLPGWDGEVRLDVVSIRFRAHQDKPEIEWFENAIYE